MLTAEQKAAIDADIAKILGRAPTAKPKPAKLVAEAGRVVAGAEVQVSPADPNYRPGPRPGFVTIDLDRVEREWFAARAAERADAAHRAELDPYNLGIWGRR
jgi:hypothetical protein